MYPNGFVDNIINDDCLRVMPHIPDKAIDMILCDLPYGVTARNKWDSIIPFEDLWLNYNRIIKDNGAIVLTATQPFTTMLIASNMDMFRYDLVWAKSNPTGFLNANRMPLRNHENILVFYKRLPTYNPQFWQSKPYRAKPVSQSNNWGNYEKTETISDGKRFPVSILEFSNATDRSKQLHPTQKPLDLFEYLVLTYSNKGDIIMDNCLGSGTTAVAAKKNERHFIGIEMNEEYYNIALERINNAS